MKINFIQYSNSNSKNSKGTKTVRYSASSTIETKPPTRIRIMDVTGERTTRTLRKMATRTMTEEQKASGAVRNALIPTLGTARDVMISTTTTTNTATTATATARAMVKAPVELLNEQQNREEQQLQLQQHWKRHREKEESREPHEPQEPKGPREQQTLESGRRIARCRWPFEDKIDYSAVTTKTNSTIRHRINIIEMPSFICVYDISKIFSAAFRYHLYALIRSGNDSAAGIFKALSACVQFASLIAYCVQFLLVLFTAFLSGASLLSTRRVTLLTWTILILFLEIIDPIYSLKCYEQTNEGLEIVDDADYKYCVLVPPMVKNGKIVVNGSQFGIGPATDTTTAYDAVFALNMDYYQILTTCILERYEFPNPSMSVMREHMFRCVCNYDMCNSEPTFVEYLSALTKHTTPTKTMLQPAIDLTIDETMNEMLDEESQPAEAEAERAKGARLRAERNSAAEEYFQE